jgi:hypothetical protein
MKPMQPEQYVSAKAHLDAECLSVRTHVSHLQTIQQQQLAIARSKNVLLHHFQLQCPCDILLFVPQPQRCNVG